MKDKEDEKVWTEAKRIGSHLGCFLNHPDWRDDVLEVYLAVEEAGAEMLESVGPKLFGYDFGWSDWYNRAKSKLEAWGVFKKIEEAHGVSEKCPVCGGATEGCQHGHGQAHEGHPSGHQDD